MKIHHIKRKFIFLSLLLGASQASFAACNQTLSPGANVASAVSNAASGTTICLNSGSYGSVSLNNIIKTSDVIVQSVSGRTASLSLTVGNGSNHLKFQNLTISGMSISGSSTKNITVAGSTFTSKAHIDTVNFNNNNILIDGNTFDAINANGGYEGRLQISWGGGPGSVPAGVTVTNNHFGNGGCSDGIQIGSYGVVVGPGNVFEGIQQGSCNEHVDSIQLYGQSHTTITGNFFRNNSVFIMAPDGGNTEIVTNNVFAGSGGQNAIQFGSHKGDTFVHNTVIGTSANMDAKSGSTSSSDATIKDNIMINASYNLNCTSCTVTHNLFNQSGNAKGTDNIIGTPTFAAGTSPSTMSGYLLTSSSVGYKAATDGKDMGIGSSGTSASTTPTLTQLSAPSNLRVN